MPAKRAGGPSMRVAVTCFLVVALLVVPVLSEPLNKVKPEDVGMSSDRLQRISQMIKRHIDAGDMTGAVAVVARKGKIAYLTAQGVMDAESKQPISPSTMFRVASMTKPVTGVAIMMMIEEGKVHLSDPVSRFIPEFRG